MINSVNGLRVGDVFGYEGNNFIVAKFPTRYTVVGTNQDTKSGEPSSVKLSLKSKSLFWKHYKTGEFVTNV